MSTQLAGVSLLSGDALRDFGRCAAARVQEAVGTKGGSALAMRFYTELLSVGAEKLPALELASLSKLLDGIRNRKLQEERDKSKGPKKKAAAKVNVGGERHGVPEDDYDGDYTQDYGAPGPAAGAAATGAAAAGGVASSGNNTNVDLSLAAAGLKASGAPAAAGGDGKFSRTKFQAEDDFM